MEDVEETLIVDIDSADKKNPLAVVEYIDDMHAYYKKTEVSNYLHAPCTFHRSLMDLFNLYGYGLFI